MADSPFSSGRVSPKRYSAQLLGRSKRPWQGSDANDPDEASEQAGKVPQSTDAATKTPDGLPAAYQSPDQGPFECDNCEHFDGAGHCNKPEVVSELGDSDDQGLADVDPKGCCNFFEKGTSGGQDRR